MILTERLERPETDALRRAGQTAELQMAHYLRRTFADSPTRLVFNDLRLEHAGEVAQIDHLVLHRFGLIVIESKSVGGTVSVNEHGEWSRWYGRQGRGMPSPVLQARRQLALLTGALEQQPGLLGRTLLGRQKTVAQASQDVLVAISDGGRITRKLPIPELFKADQVPAEVARLIESRGRLFGFSLDEGELTRVGAYLKSLHQGPPARPSAAAAVPVAGQGRHGQATAGGSAQSAGPDPAAIPAHNYRAAAASAGAGAVTAVPPPAPPPALASGQPEVRRAQESRHRPSGSERPACRQCRSVQVSVAYGKYGYYLKCATCGGNTPAKPVCASCGQAARLSKSGAVFTATCSSGHSWVYVTNPG
jgi:Nuclease-related domain